MHLPHLLSLILLVVPAALSQDQYGVKKYQDPSKLPAKVDAKGNQFGYNDCTKRYGKSSKKAHCQNIFINGVDDFCIYAPHRAKKGRTLADMEEKVVSYCLKEGYGTRLIPDGTIHGVHFLKTPEYVQVSSSCLIYCFACLPYMEFDVGWMGLGKLSHLEARCVRPDLTNVALPFCYQVTGRGDFTKVNIPADDEGGELDPHGATGSGNPIGGLVFTNARTGNFERLSEWQHFISHNEYCFRACYNVDDNDTNPQSAARLHCPHVYDEMGCYWNEPANYDDDVFEQCEAGASGAKPGIYDTSTFSQGEKITPSAQVPPESSKCKNFSSVSNTKAAQTP